MRRESLFVFVYVGVFVFFLPLISLSAQNLDKGLQYTIEKKIFIPPKFYVGDQAELRIRISADRGLKIVVPKRLPSTRWLKIDGIKVEKLKEKNYRVRIFFTSFQPGTQLLTSINLGGIELKNIQIYTSSVLKDSGNSRLGLFKGELFFPGTTYSIMILILIVVGIPLILIVSYIYLRKLVRYVMFRIKSRKPFLYTRLRLAKLERSLDRLSGTQFYRELSLVLKGYLSMKYQRNFDVLTTREMISEIETLIGNMDINKQIGDLLDSADKVKFQGLISTKKQMRESLEKVNNIVKKMEEFAPVVEF